MNLPAMSKIEQFERIVVFRSARFLPLILSVIASFILTIAILALLYSVIPSWRPKKPLRPPEPPQVSVSSSEISDYISRSAQPAMPRQTSAPVQQSNTPEPAIVSPDAKSIAAEVDAIRKQSQTLLLPWTNEYQTVCQQVLFGNCFGQRTVVKAYGVSGFIIQAFSHHNDENTPVETVPIGDASYRINPSHYEAKMAILKELETLLASAKTEDARELIDAWGKIREQKERLRDKQIRSDEERRDEEYSEAQLKYAINVAKKHRIRSESLYAVGATLIGFVFLGLILAMLAVERHTRMLEGLLASARAPVASVPLPGPPTEKKCNQCGQTLVPGDPFCSECGSQVG